MLKHKIETVLQDWKKYPSRQPAVQRYIKAYHRKIIPTLLTILSTVLGLLPFLFVRTGSRQITVLHERMVAGRAKRLR